MAALDVLQDEDLASNAARMGLLFREHMQKFVVADTEVLPDNEERVPPVALVRGRGLLNAVQIRQQKSGRNAWDLCISLKKKGLLAKPTHNDVIRFAPPLTITEPQMLEAL